MGPTIGKLKRCPWKALIINTIHSTTVAMETSGVSSPDERQSDATILADAEVQTHLVAVVGEE